MDPVMALEWQRELLELHTGPIGRRYIESFLRVTMSEWHPPDVAETKAKNESVKFSQIMCAVLTVAETYAVDDEMMDLVTYAADTLPDDTVERWTPPSPAGFVLFPSTLTFEASSPRGALHVRAVAWSIFNKAVHLFFFSDLGHNDATAELARKIGSYIGHLSYCHGQSIQLGSRIRSEEFWAEPTLTKPALTPEDEASTTRMLMTVVAFWHLSQQTIASSTPAEVPRHARKRWLRAAGTDNHVVRVVRLRRRSGPSPEGEGREWHHRWIVRGHWRQQPCGPGRTQTRPVWIAAYVKGPENAPLLSSDKINYLVR